MLETSAGELYTRAVAEPVSRPEDEHEAAAFELLVNLGLLQDEGEGCWAAVDPATVQANMVAPLGVRAAQMLQEASDWSATMEGLSKRFREVESAANPITELRGFRTINRVIEVALDDAAVELLTAAPTVGRAEAIQEAAARDIRTVKRGVSMRTLYQHSSRKSTAIQGYVDAIQEHGAQVRTLDEFFQRLIVIDRKLAFIPGAEGNQIALAIREPHLVAYLVDIFERYWSRAQPFVDKQETTAATIASDVRRMTIRMLIEGHADPSSAKRMGVSTRTYAGYIANLKDEFGAQTRFQLGYAMGLEESRALDEDEDED
ncbi:helix-turn-helix transcriptional regulator [Alteromonas gracilis]